MKKLFLLLLCAAGVVSAVYGAGKSTRSGKSAGALNGYFSVSETKQVRFSQGNLQYTRSTKTWSFAEHQYDYLGEDNIVDNTKIGAFADKIDWFGWSGSRSRAQYGVGREYDDYSGDFVDWGQNAISNGGNLPNQWRTLTADEWEYLAFTRPNAAALKGTASIDGVSGLILLPDNWRQPSNVSFKSGCRREDSASAYGAHQSYTIAEWLVLEKAGAVFLPAAGSLYYEPSVARYVSDEGWGGHYWSATSNNNMDAICFNIQPGGAYNDKIWLNGISVRLVQDVK